jgi:hypothetical protein
MNNDALEQLAPDFYEQYLLIFRDRLLKAQGFIYRSVQHV